MELPPTIRAVHGSVFGSALGRVVFLESPGGALRDLHLVETMFKWTTDAQEACASEVSRFRTKARLTLLSLVMLRFSICFPR